MSQAGHHTREPDVGRAFLASVAPLWLRDAAAARRVFIHDSMHNVHAKGGLGGASLTARRVCARLTRDCNRLCGPEASFSAMVVLFGREVCRVNY